MIDAKWSRDFSRHFLMPVSVEARVCDRTSPRVTNWNAIRRGSMYSMNPQRDICVWSTLKIWGKDELRVIISVAWYNASHSLQEMDIATSCRPCPWNDRGPILIQRDQAPDSHGHRDRQQTRQLRKDFALLFSIINEQQSQQIRTEGGWGLPVCCSGAKRSTLGLTTKSYTPTDLLKCVCA